MTHNVLTPLQVRVLHALFDNDLAERGYYLTGGTALAAYYLQHRYSDDLDFFTRKSGPFRNDFQDFINILASLAFDVSSQSFADEYLRLFISAEDQEDNGLKIEFARDVPAMMAPAEVHGRVVVDSFEDIAVNKICAILNRQPSEPKDYCDLFFILQNSRYDLAYLLSRAREKEAAFDTEEGTLAFAVNLLAVQEFQFLPRMIKPLSLERLWAYFIPIAERLIQRLRPHGG
jgi:predicted nucleotidyltransferase component of viral defense system